MPRGQKSKLQARVKRHQARCECQDKQDAQAAAATAAAATATAATAAAATAAAATAAAAAAAEVKESPPKESPPSASLFEGVIKSPPVAKSGSTSHKAQKAPPTILTSKVVFHTGSGKASSVQDETKRSNAEASPSRDKARGDPLTMKIKVLEQFLLYKYRMKQPIVKADMLKIVGQRYKHQFAEIFKKASEHIEMLFAVDVKEIDSTRQLYDLVSKLKLPNNGRVRGGRGLPKTGLLMNVLGMIFMEGNSATEEDLWKYLHMMRIYPGKKHRIYGEPRKLITQDMVRLKYLEYRQIPNSDPARYEFLWGPKAHAETSKMKVLEFLARMGNTEPTAYPTLYEEALQDEKTRAQALGIAKQGATAKVCALCHSMCQVYAPVPIDV